MPAWRAFRDELDRFTEAGREARFWWRDDDAGAATPALERLIGLRRTLGVPLAVAVVPARLEPAAAHLVAEDGIEVLQHGFDHANHAGPGDKKIELGGACRPARALDLLKQGLARLAGRTRVLPVLVPPWNRIAEALVGRLSGAGYRGLSRFGPRARPELAGLALVNAHIDVIDWHGHRGHVGDETALGVAVAHLGACRAGQRDADEPVGLMTHHAAHDEASWRFVERFAALVGEHPRARWISASEAFGIAA